MTIRKKIYSALAATLIFSSCSFDIENAVDLKNCNFFFSTEEYFSAEQIRLEDKRGYTKFVNFNGVEEIMKLDTLNLEQEFTPFKNTDINKVIWSDQYLCDTIENSQAIESITCRTTNSKLKTRLIKIDYKNGEVNSINVECMMTKMLLQTNEYLSYSKDDYYQVRRIQTLKSGKVDSTLVKVTF